MSLVRQPKTAAFRLIPKYEYILPRLTALQLTAQFFCLFYFLSYSRFFQGKVESVFLVVFIVFLSGIF